MDYTRLGRSGLKVSRLCLGTMTFGFQVKEPDAIAVLNRASEAGITLIDTADVYPLGGGTELLGETERIVGRWLKGRRNQFVLATKAHNRTGPRPWDVGNSRRHLIDAVDASLQRLGTDFIDLYQLHMYDPATPIDETLEALNDLIRWGKVRYVGCSNFLAYRLARALGRSEVLGVAQFVSAQPRYNLLFREPERELLPLCLEEGIGVISYNPLAGGLLAGKHHYARPPESGTRFAFGEGGEMYRNRYWHEREFQTVTAFMQLASEAALQPATLAVAWVLAQPAVTAPIIGASSTKQLDDLVAAADIAITPELMDRLDVLTREYRRGDAER